MKNLKTELLVNLVVMIFICILSFAVGYLVRQREVLQSGKNIIHTQKTCYDIEDLEIIIFGESQL